MCSKIPRLSADVHTAHGLHAQPVIRKTQQWRRGGGVHGEGGACVAKGGHAWYVPPPPNEIRPVIARGVRILLECILVLGIAEIHLINSISN